VAVVSFRRTLRQAWPVLVAYGVFSVWGVACFVASLALTSGGFGVSPGDVGVVLGLIAATAVGQVTGNLLGLTGLRFAVVAVLFSVAFTLAAVSGLAVGAIALFLVVGVIAAWGGYLGVASRLDVVAAWFPLSFAVGGAVVWMNRHGALATFRGGAKHALWDPFTILCLGGAVFLMLVFLAARQSLGLSAWQQAGRPAAAASAPEDAVAVARPGRGSLLVLLVFSIAVLGATALLSPYLFRTGPAKDGDGGGQTDKGKDKGGDAGDKGKDGKGKGKGGDSGDGSGKGGKGKDKGGDSGDGAGKGKGKDKGGDSGDGAGKGKGKDKGGDSGDGAGKGKDKGGDSGGDGSGKGGKGKDQGGDSGGDGSGKGQGKGKGSDSGGDGSGKGGKGKDQGGDSGDGSGKGGKGKDQGGDDPLGEPDPGAAGEAGSAALSMGLQVMAWFLGLAVALLLLLLLIGPPLRRAFLLRHLEKPLWPVSPTSRVMNLWRRALAGLAVLDIGPEAGETPGDFARRARAEVNGTLGCDAPGLMEAAAIVEKLDYAGRGLGAGDEQTMRDAVRALLATIEPRTRVGKKLGAAWGRAPEVEP
jgi:hypothetical protein